jgi:3-deoxy-manno-octulosonate cytidylyltransferase (CMP-KDO synthetase)
MSETVIIIPARLAATRLPGKPLADLGGEPMIVHVWRRAMKAGIGPVFVATDSDRIADAVRAVGGEAVATGPEHASGSDRIFEALQRIDPGGAFEIVINLQGDLPLIPPADIAAATKPLADLDVDIATLAAPITRLEERDDPNIVKVVGTELSPTRLRALYFTRAAAPFGEGVLYHHVGLYAYRRQALDAFVKLPPSGLERRERLEQLRALEAGMRIDVTLVEEALCGVDTPEALERARRLLRSK